MQRMFTRAALVAAVVVALAAFGAGAATAGTPTTLPAVQGPAVSSVVGSATPHTCLFAPAFACYGPFELGQAYDFPTTLDGSGQTIVIVDAYGSPTIQSDLALFDAFFGVPAPPSFTIIHATGDPRSAGGSGDTFGWGVETSLDVEYAHAMAPGAKIVLAVAATDDNFDINAAEAQVLPQFPGAIVSQSFGDFETDPTAGTSFAEEHQIFEAATAAHDTLLASAGDFGATWSPFLGPDSPATASYPASDPLVTSVGGTQGDPYPGGLLQGGSYGGEQVWNEPQFDVATGGAPSLLFAAPPYQRPVSGFKQRTIPDVSYNAALDGGVEVVFSPFIFLVGGTSAGSPQWASIFALVNQARALAGRGPIGFANDALYKLGKQNKSAADFHDILVGNNALDSPIGFAATPGFDLSTGWGTPDVAKIVAGLTTAPTGGNPNAGAPAHLHLTGPTTGHHAQTMVPGA